MPRSEPDFASAVSAIEAADYLRAASLAQRVRAKFPSHPDVLLLLAQALTRSARPAAAINPLRSALRTRPNDPAIRAELAFALSESGKPEQALTELDTVLETDPTHAHAVYRRCAILRELGRSEQAWGWLEARLPDLPASWAVALAVADTHPQAGDSAVPIDWLRRALAAPGLLSGDRRALLYRLARWLDRSEKYPEAFAAAQGAADLATPATLSRSEEHRHLLARCTRQTLDAIEPPHIDASHAVLVCGMPRSGTTLTEQIIAAHPKAATVGESPMLPNLCSDLLARVTQSGAVPRELTTKLAKKYLSHLASANRNAEIVIDKLPQNFVFLGLIDRLLPGCRVISCRRDPRDTALSCFLQDFDDRYPYSNALDTLADEIMLHDLAAKRWKQETSLCIFESHLEQLTGNPKQHTKQLLEFIDLPFDPACLEFHNSTQQVMTASVDQVRRKINTSGQGRWEKYQDQLAPILPRLEPLLDG